MSAPNFTQIGPQPQLPGLEDAAPASSIGNVTALSSNSNDLVTLHTRLRTIIGDISDLEKGVVSLTSKLTDAANAFMRVSGSGGNAAGASAGSGSRNTAAPFSGAGGSGAPSANTAAPVSGGPSATGPSDPTKVLAQGAIAEIGAQYAGKINTAVSNFQATDMPIDLLARQVSPLFGRGTSQAGVNLTIGQFGGLKSQGPADLSQALQTLYNNPQLFSPGQLQPTINALNAAQRLQPLLSATQAAQDYSQLTSYQTQQQLMMIGGPGAGAINQFTGKQNTPAQTYKSLLEAGAPAIRGNMTPQIARQIARNGNDWAAEQYNLLSHGVSQDWVNQLRLYAQAGMSLPKAAPKGAVATTALARSTAGTQTSLDAFEASAGAQNQINELMTSLQYVSQDFIKLDPTMVSFGVVAAAGTKYLLSFGAALLQAELAIKAVGGLGGLGGSGGILGGGGGGGGAAGAAAEGESALTTAEVGGAGSLAASQMRGAALLGGAGAGAEVETAASKGFMASLLTKNGGGLLGYLKGLGGGAEGEGLLSGVGGGLLTGAKGLLSTPAGLAAALYFGSSALGNAVSGGHSVQTPGMRALVGGVIGTTGKDAALGALLGPEGALAGAGIGAATGLLEHFTGWHIPFIGDPPNTAGMAPNLSSGLSAMMRDNPNLRISSGVRSPSQQAALYALKGGKGVAKPGHSHHQTGQAADIGPPSQLNWIAANANKYGLYNPSSSEPWHLEAMGDNTSATISTAPSASITPANNSFISMVGSLGSSWGGLVGTLPNSSGTPSQGGSTAAASPTTTSGGAGSPNVTIGNVGGGLTQSQFASDLLGALGVSASAQSKDLPFILKWEAAEGGNWNNSATYNPLNTSLPMPGSTNFSSGWSGPGVQAYSSWTEGLQATADTLDENRYTGIVSALKQGNPTAAAKALVASPWDAGGYGGNWQRFVGDPMGSVFTPSASSRGGGSTIHLHMPVQLVGTATQQDAQGLAQMVLAELSKQGNLEVLGSN